MAIAALNEPWEETAKCVFCGVEFTYERVNNGRPRNRCDKHINTRTTKFDVTLGSNLVELRPLDEMRSTGLTHDERRTLKWLRNLKQKANYRRDARLKL